jgi:hypothetical protein
MSQAYAVSWHELFTFLNKLLIYFPAAIRCISHYNHISSIFTRHFDHRRMLLWLGTSFPTDAPGDDPRHSRGQTRGRALVHSAMHDSDDDNNLRAHFGTLPWSIEPEFGACTQRVNNNAVPIVAGRQRVQQRLLNGDEPKLAEACEGFVFDTVLLAIG